MIGVRTKVGMAADDYIDLGHGACQVDIFACGDWAALWFSHTAMAQADDHVSAFHTQLPRHLPSSLDRIGEGDSAGIDCELNGVGSHHAEQTEPDAAALQ
jgi:hypothetical protein